MIYRKLGKTGLEVSAVGFGGIPIQRISKEEAEVVIHSAQEKGINFIDTARGYTISEEYIGNALRGRRDKWIIATKTMERTLEGMKKEIDISLKNLQTDHIDLYQIHNVKEMETYNQIISDNGAVQALVQAKKMGKIGHIGITAHSLDTLKVAIESGIFETIMYPYNIVENQAEDLFKRARELNIGTIAMKPMAGGALTNGYLAIKYLLLNENISCVIPGMAKIEELEQNLLPLEDLKPLSEEEKEECIKTARELGQNFCRRCGYCAPCPQGIDIPNSFLLKAYFDRYNLKDWAVKRYESASAHAEDCVECGTCETRCPYNLPIKSMIKNVFNTFGF